MRYLTIIFLFLATFASAQQQMFLRSTPAAGVTGILDSYTGAEAAYATALLYSSYGGSCLRVRRDSDNAEQDIGFSGQDIDEAAINTFCSGANCFVTTWYDQSGSGNDATQTTAANQPKIYDSSAGIIYENSEVSILADGTDQFNLPSLSYSTASIFSVYKWTSSPVFNGHIWGHSNRLLMKSVQNSSGYSRFQPYDTGYRTAEYQTNTQNVQVIASGVITGGTAYIYVNGNAGTTASVSSLGGSDSGARLLGFGLENSNHIGTVQMVVLWNADQSANRTAIETAINNYFNIFYINILILLVRLPKRKEKNAA